MKTIQEMRELFEQDVANIEDVIEEANESTEAIKALMKKPELLVVMSMLTDFFEQTTGAILDEVRLRGEDLDRKINLLSGLIAVLDPSYDQTKGQFKDESDDDELPF